MHGVAEQRELLLQTQRAHHCTIATSVRSAAIRRVTAGVANDISLLVRIGERLVGESASSSARLVRHKECSVELMDDTGRSLTASSSSARVVRPGLPS